MVSWLPNRIREHGLILRVVAPFSLSRRWRAERATRTRRRCHSNAPLATTTPLPIHSFF